MLQARTAFQQIMWFLPLGALPFTSFPLLRTNIRATAKVPVAATLSACLSVCLQLSRHDVVGDEVQGRETEGKRRGSVKNGRKTERRIKTGHDAVNDGVGTADDNKVDA